MRPLTAWTLSALTALVILSLCLLDLPDPRPMLEIPEECRIRPAHPLPGGERLPLEPLNPRAQEIAEGPGVRGTTPVCGAPGFRPRERARERGQRPRPPPWFRGPNRRVRPG